ncbi:MAG TPA: hypothetical protein VN026_17660 [Bacteroidia bacterium]|jgi:hypothetical protein|nr:hypothetical protein [Bacteroidia bacterium]
MTKKNFFVFLMFALFVTSLRSQTLTVNEVISWPRVDAEMANENLIKKGWEQYGYEINKDSGFVRRTWMIKNNYNDLKSYFQYYQSDADTIENYIIYQFSDRDAFNSYKTDLKKMGYKLQKEKKKKKKKEKNKYKDQEELYLADKQSSLISIKEVFLLGFNTFLVTSYNSRSRIAKSIIEDN